jgi:hypothetical protein
VNWHYDFEGRPIDLLTWAAMFESPARIVGRTKIGDARVSTVWVGLDLSGFGHERPLIYESMIFYANGDEETRRYATLIEAQDGHAQLVAELELLAAAFGTDESQA